MAAIQVSDEFFEYQNRMENSWSGSSIEHWDTWEAATKAAEEKFTASNKQSDAITLLNRVREELSQHGELSCKTKIEIYQWYAK